MQRAAPRHRKPYCLFFKAFAKIFRRRFLLSPENSKVGAGAGAAPESRPFFKLYMDTNRKPTNGNDWKLKIEYHE
ncbi:MAG: hypothetical protein DBX91_16235 [Subdoligranulum variabile]|nr:MAG: hypothetical protein DBX91_16235 [Subdoligranulum variabile]